REIDRNRLRKAEEERGMHQQEERRKEDRADGVDVLQRIEADTAQPPCRVVAQAVRDEAMGRLVKGDGDERRQHPGRGEIDACGCAGIHLALSNGAFTPRRTRWQAGLREWRERSAWPVSGDVTRRLLCAASQPRRAAP